MNRIYHGVRLRADNIDIDPPDYLPAKESGSAFYAQYNQLVTDIKPTEARQLGIRALERVMWARGYPLSDIELTDQSDIEMFEDSLISHLLARQQEVVTDDARRLKEMLPRLYDQLSVQLDDAIRLGYIAPEVKERLGPLCEQTEWIVSDGMGDTLGMAASIQKTALISSDVFRKTGQRNSPETNIAEVFTHEMTHRLAGVSAVGDDELVTAYRVGLIPFGKASEEPGSNWLNEAVTERIAWHLMHNDWHITNQRVTSENYTYINESMALDMLVRKLPFKVLTDYYFDESEAGHSKKALHKAFRETFGVTYPQFMKNTTSDNTRLTYIKQLTTEHSVR